MPVDNDCYITVPFELVDYLCCQFMSSESLLMICFDFYVSLSFKQTSYFVCHCLLFISCFVITKHMIYYPQPDHSNVSPMTSNSQSYQNVQFSFKYSSIVYRRLLLSHRIYIAANPKKNKIKNKNPIA